MGYVKSYNSALPPERRYARNVTLQGYTNYDKEYSIVISNRVYEKVYSVNKIHLYANDIKNMEVIMSTNYGYFKDEYGNPIKKVVLPIDSIPLTHIENPKNDNGVFAVRSASDGASCVEIYIPLGMLGMNVSKKIARGFTDIYEVYKGFYGIYFEKKCFKIKSNVNEIKEEYRKVHQKIGGANMFLEKRESFLENIKKLESLANDYYDELERTRHMANKEANGK